MCVRGGEGLRRVDIDWARERGVMFAAISAKANGLDLIGGVVGLRGEETLTVESLDEEWVIDAGLSEPRSGELFGEEELGMIGEGMFEICGKIAEQHKGVKTAVTYLGSNYIVKWWSPVVFYWHLVCGGSSWLLWNGRSWRVAD